MMIQVKVDCNTYICQSFVPKSNFAILDCLLQTQNNIDNNEVNKLSTSLIKVCRQRRRRSIFEVLLLCFFFLFFSYSLLSSNLILTIKESNLKQFALLIVFFSKRCQVVKKKNPFLKKPFKKLAWAINFFFN